MTDPPCPAPASAAARADARLATLRASLARREAQLMAARDEIVRLEHQLALVSFERDLLRNARIWRLTAPLRRLIDRVRGRRERHLPAPDGPTTYRRWIERHDTLDEGDRVAIAAHVAAMAAPPRISVVMPVFDPDPALLRAAVGSVIDQYYPYWQLCLADDGSTRAGVAECLAALAGDARVVVTRLAENRGIAAATNEALATATGDYVALMDHDDLLPVHALYMVAAEIEAHPEAGLIYSDEDQIDAEGRRCLPYFKPDWNIELMRGHNLVSHLGVYRRDLLARLGGLRAGFEGSQDYDLALRAAEAVGAAGIRHIPAILYHWRQDPGSFSKARLDGCVAAARRAIDEHLTRVGLGGMARVGALPMVPAWTRVTLSPPEPRPLVSVIVPTRNGAGLLRRCAEGVLSATDYAPIELLIVDNGSDAVEALGLLAELGRDARVRVLRAPGAFNFSALNNQAARAARGEVLVLLNNDIEILRPDWLAALVAHAVRPEIGAVGARLLYPDRRVQHAGVVLGVGGVANHFCLKEPADSPGYFGAAVLTREVGAVTAACLAVRAAQYRAVGGMDETNLAIAFNDVDFCLRLRAAGLRNLYAAEAELIHHESATRGDDMAPEHYARFKAEVAHMRARWGAILDADPFYNPNFSRKDGNFHLADRFNTYRPWQ